MTPEIALSFGNSLPLLVDSPQVPRFYVAKTIYIVLTICTGLLLFLVAYYWMVRKTRMLKDPSGIYSLGKSQMAFWGLIVFFTFIGIWVLTGRMEFIPTQVLILLGISGATGLSAVIMENEKDQKNRNENPSALKKDSTGFWRDICSDSAGPAFYRLQVVAWTVVLGILFIRSVTKGLSMPEFSETLLLLMGISNLTYLGFKFPEKK